MGGSNRVALERHSDNRMITPHQNPGFVSRNLPLSRVGLRLRQSILTERRGGPGMPEIHQGPAPVLETSAALLASDPPADFASGAAKGHPAGLWSRTRHLVDPQAAQRHWPGKHALARLPRHQKRSRPHGSYCRLNPARPGPPLHCSGRDSWQSSEGLMHECGHGPRRGGCAPPALWVEAQMRAVGRTAAPNGKSSTSRSQSPCGGCCDRSDSTSHRGRTTLRISWWVLGRGLPVQVARGT